MGSPISGFIADAVMQSIEAKIMAQYRPRLWLRFVDDTFVIINRNDLQHFHTIINSMNGKIKFSRREKQNNQLPFLDVLVRRHRDGKISTSAYRKSWTSDIVLHYSINHPTNHKRLCGKTLFDHAQLHCSDRTTLALDHSYLLNMFRNCRYPLSFGRRSMRRNIPRGHGQRGNLTPEVPSEDQRTRQDSGPRWATLPYIYGISETLARHLRIHNTSKWQTNLRPPSELPWWKPKTPFPWKRRRAWSSNSHAKDAMPNMLEKLVKH